MVVVILSRVPSHLEGVLTRWLLEVRDGTYVGNVSASIRRSIWQRIESGVGRGSALMVWPSKNDQGLEFVSHNHEWELVDSDGLTLVRKPTQDETQRRRALEVYSGLSAPEINRLMASWLRKNHPKARIQRKRTTPGHIQAVRARRVDSGVLAEQQSMQEGSDGQRNASSVSVRSTRTRDRQRQ